MGRGEMGRGEVTSLLLGRGGARKTTEEFRRTGEEMLNKNGELLGFNTAPFKSSECEHIAGAWGKLNREDLIGDDGLLPMEITLFLAPWALGERQEVYFDVVRDLLKRVMQLQKQAEKEENDHLSDLCSDTKALLKDILAMLNGLKRQHQKR